MEERDGSVLANANVLSINGQPAGLPPATVEPLALTGFWNATIRLKETFAAGSHLMEATYIPTVNYYVGSDNNTTLIPVGFGDELHRAHLDGIGQPSLERRTERGTPWTFCLVARQPGCSIANQSVVGSLPTSTCERRITRSITVLIAPLERLGLCNLTVPCQHDRRSDGDLRYMLASLVPTALSAMNATSQFVVLGQTDVVITEAVTTVLVAGDTLVVNGTLLDDLGLVLQSNGVVSTAIVHLLIGWRARGQYRDRQPHRRLHLLVHAA
ncbi:MAG: hypothetical protein CM15mP78_07210 [Candidatus Poseidoniales archaeon]|nr:MAG: hypothetical protein CM15mP78_07210 [Candidatus Poseidoniales archaeon]